MTPEAQARQTIDALLTAAGWHVCYLAEADIHTSVGVAIREVEAEVDTNLKRVQALRRAALSNVFSV